MLIDSHAHLDSERLSGEVEAIMRRAREAGVGLIQCIACATQDPDTIDRVMALTRDWPEIVTAVGVHPHDASSFDDALGKRISGAMENPRVRAWGEIGLDYYYDNSPREIQQQAFRKQLRLARAADKPVILHSRDAAEDTLRIVGEELATNRSRGVMHCFTYGRDIAEAALKAGLLLGIGGIVTFPRSTELVEIVRELPLESFLIETDSPYLAPVPYRGKTNEPSFVARVAQKIAEVRGISAEQVAAQTTANFQRLFGPVPAGL